MWKVLVYLVSIISVLTAIDIPIITEDIGKEIFHENKIYLIYVYDGNYVEQTMQIFKEFCENGHLCAILNEEVENYSAFRAFIGENDPQFFSIVDATRRKKYVLPIVQGITVTDLFIFQSKFQQGNLEPYLASQQPDEEPYLPCRKIVSKDLDSFLTSETPVKVLFLYTMHEACEICGQILRTYADISEKMYDANVVSFGYYDIFKNDHPKIQDEILPYFLIFSNGEEEPVGVPAQQIEDLSNIIVEIVMKDVKMQEPEWKQSKKDKLDIDFQSINHEVQLQDIELDDL